MELKDVILSTLAEMEENSAEETAPVKNQTPEAEQKTDINESKQPDNEEGFSVGEEKFLESVRERLLVLFEGFQSPNNQQIEAKVDMTLNFLEYLLTTIDARLERLNEKESR